MQAAIKNVVRATLRAHLYASLCTFESPDGFDAAGAPIPNVYTPISGLENLTCMSSVPSQARIQATEVRAMNEITASELHHVLLPAYYPSLDNGWRGDGSPAGQWVINLGDNVGGVLTNGVIYQIMGVEFDSQNQMTRVSMRLGTL